MVPISSDITALIKSQQDAISLLAMVKKKHWDSTAMADSAFDAHTWDRRDD